MNFLGIDPGASGGIACVYDGGVPFAEARKMPGTPKDILAFLCNWDLESSVAMIEKVHAMPKQGVSSTFKFGQNFGQLQMALAASGVRWEEVTPQKWQKEFGLILPNLSNTDKKNRHKAAAQQLFPSLKITHAIADALLIAEYCRRRNA